MAIHWRFYASVLLLIAGGVLAAAGMIVAKKPNAKDLIDKLTPHQGYIGGVLVAFGLWQLIDIVTHLDAIKFLMKLPFWQLKFFVVMEIVSVPVSLLLGFLLGWGLISKYAAKSDAAKEKGEAMRAKLQKIAGPLGIVGALNGIGLLISIFLVKALFKKMGA